MKYLRRKLHNNLNNKKLPSFFFFTDRKRLKNIFTIIKDLPNQTAIIVREYDLNYEERLIFIKKIQSIAKEKSLLVLVAKDLRLALETNADGVHFTDNDKSWQKYLHYKNLNKKDFIFACCCHKLPTLIKADKLNLDVIFYSPVFSTKTHPDKKPIGISKFRKYISNKKTPIYALGGINKENIRLLKSCNISGIAGISLFS